MKKQRVWVYSAVLFSTLMLRAQDCLSHKLGQTEACDFLSWSQQNRANR
jgi:hypothetical protein